MFEDKTVTINAPARLHMGFIDINGDLGRNFGGLGLTLSGISTRLTVQQAAETNAVGPSSRRAAACARSILKSLELDRHVHVRIESAIPEHIGLGSGTQLSLAVSAAIAKLFCLDRDMADLARITDRGGRSGIGVGAFQHGGFLVDGGRGDNTAVPPLIFRMAFPERWRILLIFERSKSGLNGASEKNAFDTMPPMEQSMSARLCRLLVMQVLPALKEADSDRFGQGITCIQDDIGDYFATYQNGRFSSAAVADVLGWLRSKGVCGLGQSSWGPTGFALFENEIQAGNFQRVARKRWGEESGLEFMICKARNDGAEFTSHDRAAQVV